MDAATKSKTEEELRRIKKVLVLACTEYPLLLDSEAMAALEKDWNCRCVVPEDTLVEALLDYEIEKVKESS